MWTPTFRCVLRADGEREYRVGHDLVDEFLEFVSVRARPNTIKAYAHDLKVFFSVVDKDPVEVTPADVLRFVTEQNRPRDGADNVVRISDGRAGLSASTIKRRLAAVSSLYGYLVTTGAVSASPVPRGLPTRKSRHRGERGLPLVRGVRRLPRILEPGEVEALMGRCARPGIGRWSRPWCWAGCDAARSSVCAWRICGSVSGGCSSPMARAATNA